VPCRPADLDRLAVQQQPVPAEGGGPHSLDRNAGELRETPAGSNSPYPCKGAMKL
jgi:hypothetical protein